MTMTRMMSAFCALIAFTLMIASAQAQEGTRVFVFNQQEVLKQSVAWTDAQEKLGTMQQEMQAELETANESLNAAQDEFQAQRDIVAPDKLEDLQRDFTEKVVGFTVQQEKARIELENAARAAQARINNSIREIIDSLAAEKNADVVLERGTVIFSSVDIDLTQQIVSRLNNSKKAINVERIPLNDEQTETLRQQILNQVRQAQAGARG